MSNNIVPMNEVELLIDLILQNFWQQYGKKIERETVTPGFIPPRTDTRFGFELDTVLSGQFLKIRLYCHAFTLGAQINPFRQEEVINEPLGYGDEVFVAITDLPLGLFPFLSKIDNPQIGDDINPYGIEMEDMSGYIQLETGDVMEVEH